jgi:hypothetical protein
MLEWCTNPQYSAQHVRHNNVRSLSAKAIKEFVPDGVQSADFTEPLDGSQRLIFYFRCLYDAIKELLRNARFTGRQYTQAVIKLDAVGKRVYSAFNTGEVYEIAQVKAGPNVSPVPVFLSSDATLVDGGARIYVSRTYVYVCHSMFRYAQVCTGMCRKTAKYKSTYLYVSVRMCTNLVRICMNTVRICTYLYICAKNCNFVS